MPQIIIGAQILHATGVAMGFKKKNEKRVAITYTGDGGSSEGDFYEGLNFAGVFKLPAIFFVQNNGYAITTPFAKQTAAQSIAHKAVAAGIRGVQVDGMDVLAVIQSGAGSCRTRSQRRRRYADRSYDLPFPSAFDGVTTRPNIARKKKKRSGSLRIRSFASAIYLKNKGLWTEEDTAHVMEEAKATVNEQIKKAEADRENDGSWLDRLDVRNNACSIWKNKKPII